MLFIPFERYSKSVGGPSTFLRNLKKYMDKNSYPYIEDEERYSEAGGIFFPMSFNSFMLNYFKKRNLPIIQRLDGVFYPSKHGIRYIFLNREIKKDYFKYASYVIFQSKYSRTECFTMFGEMPEDKYEIIINGTDNEIYYQGDKEFDKSKIIFTTTGSYRNKDMVEPVVLALDEVSKDYNIELRVIGPVTDQEVENLMDRSYINALGKLGMEKIADNIRETDIFIHCQLNPACPNSVIESVSCGVPVVGFDTGAMKEVLWFSPELLAYVSDDIFQRYEDFDYKKLAEKIYVCIENYSKYKKIFMENSNLYDFNITGEKYIKIFSRWG